MKHATAPGEGDHEETARGGEADEAGPLLTLLGEPRLRRQSRADHLLERRDAALLALLALDGPQPRALLARWLWPDVEPAAALNNLRQRLFRLRRHADAPLVSGTDRLRLDGAVRHDLGADAVGIDALDTTLLGALDFHDCEVLSERVDDLRSRWQQRCVEKVERMVNQHQDAGRLDQALTLALRLLRVQPDSEHAHRRVMQLHFLRGDRAAGMAAYEHCRAWLLKTVGSEPSVATQSLAQLIASSAGVPPPHNAPTYTTLTLARPPRLVGRDTEWQALRSAWDRGAVIVLRGVPGIGKTRLAEDFVRSQGNAIMVKLHAGEQTLPYSLLAHLLRLLKPRLPDPPDWAAAELARLAPNWGSPATDALQPLRLQQALVAALVPWPASVPDALLIDDLQWADAASLEALLPWLGHARGQPLRVLLTVRDGQIPQALAGWLHAQPPDAALDWPLGPLAAPAVRNLLLSLDLPKLDAATADKLAASLMLRVGGHPYMLLELLRVSTIGDRVDLRSGSVADSPSLQQLLHRRLATVPSGALRLLRLGSLSGSQFTVSLAAGVLALHPADLVDDWQLLIDHQLLQPGGHLYDAVAQVVRAGLPVPIARELHAAIAAALQRQSARPEQVAAHWLDGGDPGAAARCYVQAAELAQALSRRVEELAFRDQAAACHDQAGERDLAWRARHQAAVTALVVEDARQLTDRLAALSQHAATDSEQLDALLAQCRAQINGLAGPGVVPLAIRARELARRLSDRTREITASSWHGLALALAGDSEAALKVLEPLHDQALQVTDTRTQLDYFGSLGYVMHLAGHYQHALDAIGRAEQLATQMGDLAEAQEQAGNQMVCLLSLGRRDAALAHGERALALWHRLGEPESVSAAAQMVYVGTIHFGQGRFRESLDRLNRALDCFQRLGPPSWRTIAEHRLHSAYTRLGQHARALQVLTPLPDDADAGRRATRQMNLCRSQAGQGLTARTDIARKLRHTLDQYESQLSRQDRHSLQLLLASHLSAPDATALCRQVLADAQSTSNHAVALHARARLADGLRRSGELAAAAHEAAAAWSDAQATAPQDLEHTALCWMVFLAADAGDDAVTAEAALRSGVQWIASALPHVPAEFVDSFRCRNPVHRELLATAARRISFA